MVFLHNIELSSFIWEKTIDKFARHFTCHVIDLPGHDHSDIPPRQYSFGDYGEAIVDVLDGAGIQQASFVGSHGGCVVALNLAASHPERVKKLGAPYWNLEQATSPCGSGTGNRNLRISLPTMFPYFPWVIG